MASESMARQHLSHENELWNNALLFFV